MKFYFAFILSAALHFAAGVWISHNLIKTNPVKNIQAPLWVSLKQALAETSTKRTSQKPQSNQAKQQADVLTNYFSEQDVEIKAFPNNNIDQTKLEGVFISGLSIKMRLYINDAGRVVKIERLNALGQDYQLQKALEKILLEMAFLPAKKNGVAVNAYQDISFGFN